MEKRMTRSLKLETLFREYAIYDYPLAGEIRCDVYGSLRKAVHSFLIEYPHLKEDGQYLIAKYSDCSLVTMEQISESDFNSLYNELKNLFQQS